MSCLGVYAQNKQPSIEELKSYCKSMQNNLNILESKIDSIHLMQMEKLKELADTAYNINTLKQSNIEIYKGIKEVLKIIPDVYAEDTTNNIALVQFGVLQESYNKYCTTIFNDNTISIKDNFRIIIEDVSKKINEIKEKLKADESYSDEPLTVDSREGLSIEIWIILALIILLYVIVITLIISDTKIRNNLTQHIGIFNKSDESINDKIEKLREKIENLPIGDSKSRGGRNTSPGSSSIGQNELNELKSELQNKINEVKTELLNKITHLNDHSQPDSHKVGVTRTECSDTIYSNTPQNSTAKPAVKGLYAQLQENGSFKTYDDDRNNAFYIITPNFSSETTGEFFLKELTPETAMAAIDGRNSLLIPACEIINTSGNSRRVKMESPGIAEKRGNEWYVKEKAKISLVD